MAELSHLKQPLTLNHLTLKNRVVFGAHTSNMSVQGLPGAQHLAYYRERAMGGAAMIVVEPMPVHATAVLTRGNFRHSDDGVIPHFKKLTDACHAHDCVVLQQLYHVGQHGDADNSYQPNWSPSGLPSWHDSDGSHAMSESEIHQIINGFINAAVRCQKAGFDGVEVWAAYHCIIDQFWTPWSNQREDRWGGSLENRLRLSEKILSGIRKACGPHFIIGLSVSDEPDVEIALGRESLTEILSWLDQRGLMDYVSCGSGGYFDFYKLMPTFLYPEKLGVPLASDLKRTLTHAVVQAESHIRTPELANQVIASGEADMVSIVRGQIADPQWANKAVSGKATQIRGCLSCNQMCWGRRSRDYSISCLINPSVGREHEWGSEPFKRATDKKSILIVGAGPAGLECARVAAERGHHVLLYEASGHLGGQFYLAGLQPRRGQILDLLQWYQDELDRLGVQVHYHHPLFSEDIVALKSQHAIEHVVLATGSEPYETGFQKALAHLPELPGYNPNTVFSIESVMRREARLGQSVVVLDEGGNWRGCGTAWYLMEKGHQVTLVTPDPMVGKELARSATDFPLRQRLAQGGVQCFTEHAVSEWHGDHATLLSLLDGCSHTLSADSLVLATCNRAENTLAKSLEADNQPFSHIGDCVAPRQAAYAFYEGRALALSF